MRERIVRVDRATCSDRNKDAKKPREKSKPRRDFYLALQGAGFTSHQIDALEDLLDHIEGV